jgi:hypothetical protein
VGGGDAVDNNVSFTKTATNFTVTVITQPIDPVIFNINLKYIFPPFVKSFTKNITIVSLKLEYKDTVMNQDQLNNKLRFNYTTNTAKNSDILLSNVFEITVNDAYVFPTTLTVKNSAGSIIKDVFT